MFGLGLLVATALVVGGWIHAADADGRALRALPPDARSHLYARTLQNLDSFCRQGSTMVATDFCQAQARVVLSLPECDGACTLLARAVLRVPTR